MERRLIITNLNQKILSAVSEDDKITELRFDDTGQESILGNIYIGKVKNIVKNIQAAFVEIEPGRICYLSIRQTVPLIILNRKNASGITAGDELLVQVSRESNGTKPPTLTGELNFNGKYLILTAGKCRVGVSGKLDQEEKQAFRLLLEPYVTEEYGFIVRTNAREADKSTVIKEIQLLVRQYQEIVNKAEFRTCYSLLRKSVPAYLSVLQDTYSNGLSKIITDDRKLYTQLEEYLRIWQPEDLEKLSFYEDDLLPMMKLYRLEHVIKEATQERVWLKSGGYLVIQPTEALTVIDVNTGKYDGKKKQQDTFLKINLEAAGQIAYQLRLRNISGIVIVDFINMESRESRDRLLEELDKALYNDPVKTVLVGMTPLNLVEITRKKMRKPLREQI